MSLIALFVILCFLIVYYHYYSLSELLAEEPDVKDAPDAQPLALNKSIAPTIEFKNIYFHYPTQTSNSGLQGVHFKIEPGTETAVVGHTGSVSFCHYHS